MPTNRNPSRPNPFHGSFPKRFFAGEPQEEALSRIEYLRSQGGGWCLVTGPRGIGKSMLLQELAHRLDRRGENCSSFDFLTGSSADWLACLAESWQIPRSRSASSTDVLPSIEEHLIGWGMLNRPVWLLCDFHEPLPTELIRNWRWLRSRAVRHELPLTIVVACRDGEDLPKHCDDADLSLALWSWGQDDSARYVKRSLQSVSVEGDAFTPEAISALHERTEGVPGALAKLCEFTWLAAEAESIGRISPDLVHAVADELLPAPSRVSAAYEQSAGYGAW